MRNFKINYDGIIERHGSLYKYCKLRGIQNPTLYAYRKRKVIITPKNKIYKTLKDDGMLIPVKVTTKRTRTLEEI